MRTRGRGKNGQILRTSFKFMDGPLFSTLESEPDAMCFSSQFIFVFDYSLEAFFFLLFFVSCISYWSSLFEKLLMSQVVYRRNNWKHLSFFHILFHCRFSCIIWCFNYSVTHPQNCHFFQKDFAFFYDTDGKLSSIC